ncbi:hypothetical protein B2J93_4619 [Marssonina coronariae]|uniref:Prenylated Rab acceptor 1 n=1 Tax=Diplocarpon coronariae TaxID=2795749 RepID=A0A218Z381_9HELO|nr:hypothetical protein B2J93_4619 [Marssonina coronariae]
MPSWGRPPGAKGSRRRGQWEQQEEFWNEARVEELESDDTDIQGDGSRFEKRRVYSDPLYLTGGNQKPASRARRSYAFADSGDSMEDTDESEIDGTDTSQIALRDKEEALVQSALARIRRAQEKGRREVKLNQDELDALESRRKRMQAAATTKVKKASGSSGGSDREKRRRSDRISVPIALAAAESLSRPSSRHNSKKHKSKSRKAEEAANPPGMLVAGPDGPVYATLGSYPSQPARNSPSRPRSSSTQQMRNNPVPNFSLQQGSGSRNFSDGMRPASSSSNSSRRRLPDDEEWMPTSSNRSSASSQGFTVDPFEYQVSSDHLPPIPQQYLPSRPISNSHFEPQQGRRNVSGPAEISYSSIRRAPPATSGYASRAPTSEPALRSRRRDHEPAGYESSSEEDASDHLGNGVQVVVEEENELREGGRERENIVARKPVGGKRKGKRR